MGRINQAMQRARKSEGLSGLRPLPGIAVDIAVLAAEPFPDEVLKQTEVISAPVIPVAAKPAASSRTPARKRLMVLPPPPSLVAPPLPISITPKLEPAAPKTDDDETAEIKELFFNTYHEKVWSGPQS